MFIIQSLWYILPAGLANMMPVFVRKYFKFLEIPVDFGKKFKNKSIFGSHKTWRGVIFGIIGSMFLILIQALLYFNFEIFRKISLIKFENINFILLGFLLGFGALFGDLVKSFFKRQINVKPGAKFFPWDQIDFILGALLFSSIVFRPKWYIYIFLILIIPFFHIFFNHFGYWIGIQKTKW
ncbi:MAG: CDP-archaeol synthase [Patescibacteria group bacterium]